MSDRDCWDYQYPKEIEGAKLIRTCFACPEQYDVYLDDIQIGYLRLRHGSFTASYIDVGGEIVYHAYPKGDGIFYLEEREFFLKEAIDSLLATHKTKSS